MFLLHSRVVNEILHKYESFKYNQSNALDISSLDFLNSISTSLLIPHSSFAGSDDNAKAAYIAYHSIL